jgi:putative drug exporter of the RND superfamily
MQLDRPPRIFREVPRRTTSGCAQPRRSWVILRWYITIMPCSAEGVGSEFVAAVMPLLSALFSVFAGLAIVGLLAAAITFPTTAPTVATLLGLGVAIDYRLFLIARHREQLDHGTPVIKSAGRSTATSGAAIVVAGSTVVVSILGLYVSGVPFVGAMGLASAIVVAVAMLSALTLMAAFMGVAKQNVRSIKELRATKRAASGSLDESTAASRVAALATASDEAHERIRAVGPKG